MLKLVFAVALLQASSALPTDNVASSALMQWGSNEEVVKSVRVSVTTTTTTAAKIVRVQSFSQFFKNDNSKVVTIDGFTSPKIFPGPLTRNGGDSSVVRINGNVLYIVESPCEDGTHYKQETIDVMTFEQGVHAFGNQTIAVFQSDDVPFNTATKVTFPTDANFQGAVPVCVAQIQSNKNDKGYINTILTAIDATSVTVKLVPDDKGNTGSNKKKTNNKNPEDVAFVCMTKGDFTFGGSHSHTSENGTTTTVTNYTQVQFEAVTVSSTSNENVATKNTVSTTASQGIASIRKTSTGNEPEAMHLRKASGSGFSVHVEEDDCGGEKSSKRGHKAVEEINAILWK